MPNRTALVLGGSGMLAQELPVAFSAHGFDVKLVSRSTCDVTSVEMVRETLARWHPGLVVNCAAWTNVDGAESRPDDVFAVNSDGAGNVARAAAVVDAALLHISTDYVFDGLLGRPYRENDVPSPLGVYGRSKFAGEQQVKAAANRGQIVRTGGLYGRGGRNFFAAVLARARAGKPLRVVDDQVASPTWTRDLAGQLAILAKYTPPGLYHATAAGQTTWYAAARTALEFAGVDADLQPVSSVEWGSPAPRPRYSVLAHQALGRLGLYRMRHWRESLRTWLLDPNAELA